MLPVSAPSLPAPTPAPPANRSAGGAGDTGRVFAALVAAGDGPEQRDAASPGHGPERAERAEETGPETFPGMGPEIGPGMGPQTRRQPDAVMVEAQTSAPLGDRPKAGPEAPDRFGDSAPVAVSGGKDGEMAGGQRLVSASPAPDTRSDAEPQARDGQPFATAASAESPPAMDQGGATAAAGQPGSAPAREGPEPGEPVVQQLPARPDRWAPSRPTGEPALPALPARTAGPGGSADGDRTIGDRTIGGSGSLAEVMVKVMADTGTAVPETDQRVHPGGREPDPTTPARPRPGQGEVWQGLTLSRFAPWKDAPGPVAGMKAGHPAGPAPERPAMAAPAHLLVPDMAQSPDAGPHRTSVPVPGVPGTGVPGTGVPGTGVPVTPVATPGEGQADLPGNAPLRDRGGQTTGATGPGATASAPATGRAEAMIPASGDRDGRAPLTAPDQRMPAGAPERPVSSRVDGGEPVATAPAGRTAGTTGALPAAHGGADQRLPSPSKGQNPEAGGRERRLPVGAEAMMSVPPGSRGAPWTGLQGDGDTAGPAPPVTGNVVMGNVARGGGGVMPDPGAPGHGASRDVTPAPLRQQSGDGRGAQAAAPVDMSARFSTGGAAEPGRARDDDPARPGAPANPPRPEGLASPRLSDAATLPESAIRGAVSGDRLAALDSAPTLRVGGAGMPDGAAASATFWTAPGRWAASAGHGDPRMEPDGQAPRSGQVPAQVAGEAGARFVSVSGGPAGIRPAVWPDVWPDVWPGRFGTTSRPGPAESGASVAAARPAVPPAPAVLAAAMAESPDRQRAAPGMAPELASGMAPGMASGMAPELAPGPHPGSREAASGAPRPEPAGLPAAMADLSDRRSAPRPESRPEPEPHRGTATADAASVAPRPAGSEIAGIAASGAASMTRTGVESATGYRALIDMPLRGLDPSPEMLAGTGAPGETPGTGMGRLAPAATAAQLGAQIAAQIGTPGTPPRPGSATELALSPPELGRVVIRFEGDPTGGTLFVQVERPETLELMRRNMEALEAALRAAGHEGCGVALSGREQGAGQNRPQDGLRPAGSGPEADPNSETPPLRSAPAAGSGRLDLRL